ncbi:MAG: GNAT family N-acetyltransferase [Baekduia sp.]
MVLTADRICLRRLTPTEVRTILAGGRLPGGSGNFAPGYPMEGTLLTLAMQSDARSEPSAAVFGHFQIVRLSDRQVIGDIGFHGPPDELGEATISYGVVPSERGRGYATEAVRALLGWAMEQPEIRVVRAESDVANHASHHVLASAGMRHTLDSGERRVFEIQAR